MIKNMIKKWSVSCILGLLFLVNGLVAPLEGFPGSVPSPPCAGCGGKPSVPKPLAILQPSPLLVTPIPNAVEYDGSNFWLTDKNGIRGSIFSGNAPSKFNNTVTFGSFGILDFNKGSVINFADGSVWKSTGLIFDSGTSLSLPDGSAWDSSGLIFGTSGTETFPDGSKWSSGGLTFGTSGTETLPDGSMWNSSGLNAKAINTDSVINVKYYGATGNGTTDDTTAIQKAAYTALAINGVLYFPAGNYLISSPINFNFTSGDIQDITILGDGPDQSKISSSVSGFVFNTNSPFQSANIKNISILSTVTPTSSNAIFYNYTGTTGNVAVSSIENVTIRGSDGYTKTNAFSKGILIQNQSYINIYNVNVYGTSTITNTGFGIYIEQSSTSRPIPLQYNVTSSGVYNYQSGVIIGNAVQRLTINQSNFVNNDRGIYILPEATGIKQIGIVNSSINSSNGILISSPVFGLTISQCYIMFANDGSGIFLGTNGMYASILGNTISARSPSPTGTNGIHIYGAQSTIITGNNFISVNIGVNILSTGSGITVQGNKYSAVTTDVSNDGKSNIIGVASD